MVSPYTLPALREDNRLTQFEQTATATGAIRSRYHGHRSTNASAPTVLEGRNIAAPDCDLDELTDRLLAQCEDERRRAEERYRAEVEEERRREERRRRYKEQWLRKQCKALIVQLGYEPLYLDILYRQR